jgi:hypothetical protein
MRYAPPSSVPQWPSSVPHRRWQKDGTSRHHETRLAVERAALTIEQAALAIEAEACYSVCDGEDGDVLRERNKLRSPKVGDTAFRGNRIRSDELLKSLAPRVGLLHGSRHWVNGFPVADDFKVSVI